MDELPIILEVLNSEINAQVNDWIRKEYDDYDEPSCSYLEYLKCYKNQRVRYVCQTIVADAIERLKNGHRTT